MKLYWLELAEKDLDSIYNFYAKDKSQKAATKIYNEILNVAEKLIDFPLIGQIEEEISEEREEYRSLLVRKLFRIIYFIDADSLFIVAIWDCRKDFQTNKKKIQRNINL